MGTTLVNSQYKYRIPLNLWLATYYMATSVNLMIVLYITTITGKCTLLFIAKAQPIKLFLVSDSIELSWTTRS